MEGSMPKFAIDCPPVVALPVAGSDALFPVRRVYCIGRNYAAHTIEMGHDPDREDPFFFQKNPDNLDTSGTFPYPPKSSDVHHEVEMAVMLGSGGRDIPVDKALECVFGYAASLDMTRRDLQGAAKDKRRPWDLGKDFEGSAVLSALTPAAALGEIGPQRIWLSVNGAIRQDAHLSELVHGVAEIVADLSRFYHLAPGDLIMTGTPAGVGAVGPGDLLEGGVEGLDPVTLTIGPPEA